jgi:hypothetical protein
VARTRTGRAYKKAACQGEFCKTSGARAARSLERAGVPSSTAIALVGHRTESIYRRYSIDDEPTLKEAATILAILHRPEAVNLSEPVAASLNQGTHQ